MAEERPFLPISIAVLTVSDTRGPAEDTSGDTLVARLEAAGLVVRRRDPADGRGVLVEITDAGRTLANKATALLNEEVFSRPELTSSGMRTLVDTLRELRQDAGDFEQ